MCENEYEKKNSSILLKLIETLNHISNYFFVIDFFFISASISRIEKNFDKNENTLAMIKIRISEYFSLQQEINTHKIDISIYFSIQLLQTLHFQSSFFFLFVHSLASFHATLNMTLNLIIIQNDLSKKKSISTIYS